MESNLNKTGLTAYCTRFTDRVVNDFFNNKGHITGQELKSLTPIQQINLFVIKNLFEAWKKETEQLKSIYFDYEAPEVKTALEEFMNVLSRYIRIDREAFYPLIHRAVKEAAMLIFSPYDFYTHFNQSEEPLPVQYLKELARYVRVNENLMKELINALEQAGVTELDREHYARELNKVFNKIQAEPVDIDIYLEQFSAVELLTEEIVYGEAERSREPISNTADFSTTPETGEQDKELITLHDQLSTQKRPTLADIHQNKKIDSIKSHLSINQRFMFINTLFQGNEEHFNETITHLEQMESKTEAVSYLQARYSEWDEESEEVEEFYSVVSKRLH